MQPKRTGHTKGAQTTPSQPKITQVKFWQRRRTGSHFMNVFLTKISIYFKKHQLTELHIGLVGWVLACSFTSGYTETLRNTVCVPMVTNRTVKTWFSHASKKLKIKNKKICSILVLANTRSFIILYQKSERISPRYPIAWWLVHSFGCKNPGLNSCSARIRDQFLSHPR